MLEAQRVILTAFIPGSEFYPLLLILGLAETVILAPRPIDITVMMTAVLCLFSDKIKTFLLEHIHLIYVGSTQTYSSDVEIDFADFQAVLSLMNWKVALFKQAHLGRNWAGRRISSADISLWLLFLLHQLGPLAPFLKSERWISKLRGWCAADTRNKVIG